MTVAMLVALMLGWGAPLVEDPAESEAIATAVQGCVSRDALDPVMVLSVIAQESGFQKDPCARRVRLENVVSREPVEGHEGREVVSWRCRGDGSTCRRESWEFEERNGYLYFSTCPAGEVGYMQVLRSSSWARSGFPIPGTEYVAVAMADGIQSSFPTPLDITQDTTAVLVNGERVSRSRFTVTDEAEVELLDVPPVGAQVVVSEALSTSSRERRQQLLTARINIALGCAELVSHRTEAPARFTDDGWWEWVGSYNTGTVHGPTAHQYARRLLRHYVRFCELTVPTDQGDRVFSEVLSAECAAAAEALEDWHVDD